MDLRALRTSLSDERADLVDQIGAGSCDDVWRLVKSPRVAWMGPEELARLLFRDAVVRERVFEFQSRALT